MKEPKELIELFRELKNPKEVGEEISRFCNSFSVNIRGFLDLMEKEDEPTLKAWHKVAMLWILKCQKYYLEDYYDLRNKASVTTADKLVKALKEEIKAISSDFNYDGWVLGSYEYGYELYPTRSYEDERPVPFELIFVEKMGRDHRTLQQTFSKIVFWYLGRKYGEALTKQVGESFWILPCY